MSLYAHMLNREYELNKKKALPYAGNAGWEFHLKLYAVLQVAGTHVPVGLAWNGYLYCMDFCIRDMAR
jgi:hypothetical protein